MSTATIDQPQHLAALQRANSVRQGRRELKAWVAAPGEMVTSRRRVAELLLDPPPELRTMRVEQLLRAAHRTGRVNSRRLLSLVGLSVRATLADATERQRVRLASMLGAPQIPKNGVATAQAAAVMDRLWAAGLRQAGIAGWWCTERAELDDQEPRNALAWRPSRVLSLAERDADAIRQDLARHHGGKLPLGGST